MNVFLQPEFLLVAAFVAVALGIIANIRIDDIERRSRR